MTIWQNLTSFSTPEVNHQSYIFQNSILYVFGGSETADLSREYISNSTINQLDGSISSWTTSSMSKMLYPVIWHSFASYKNHLYLLGGFNEIYSGGLGVSINNIQSTDIDSSGNIGTWFDLETKLVTPLNLIGVTSIGNKIYYSGGGTWDAGHYDNPPLNPNVYMSVASESGELSTWNGVGDLPEPLLGHAMYSIGNKLYVMGGVGSDYNTRNKVWVTTLDSSGYIDASASGTVNGWTDTGNDMLTSVYHFMSTRIGDYIVVAGGRGPHINYATIHNEVYLAHIKPDGSLEKWEKAREDLPYLICCGSMAATDSRIYLTGGYAIELSRYLNTVYMASLNDLLPISDPTPTPPPTPPTPTPPPPTPAEPIVLVPGMGGSWNFMGLMHNQPMDHTYWKLMPFDETYDGLIKTLENAGYEKDKTLYIYAYDWRRDVRTNSLDLQQYINDHVLNGKPEGTKVNFVGHSMGGLVIREAAKGQFLDKINKIVTAGTPYEGSSLAYNVWEGADYSKLNDEVSAGIQLLVRRYAGDYDSEVETIQNIMPSWQNLLPTWKYLVNKNGNYINPKSLKWVNNLSTTKNDYWPMVLDKLGSIYGSGIDSIQTIYVTDQNLLDKLWGKWVDGMPINYGFGSGDGAVLKYSASATGAAEYANLAGIDHGGTISSLEGQINILRMLGINISGTLINLHKINKSIVVTVASPAIFEVIAPGDQILSPKDGVLFINDPKDGNYKIKLTSTGSGDYTLYFGRLTTDDSAWEEKHERFSSTNQIRNFDFNVDFESKNLGADPLANAEEKITILRLLAQEFDRSVPSQKLAAMYIDQLSDEYDLLPTGNKEQDSESVYKIVKLDNLGLQLSHNWNPVPVADPILLRKVSQQLRWLKLDLDQYLKDL